jgi:hypothetical protein
VVKSGVEEAAAEDSIEADEVGVEEAAAAAAEAGGDE